MNIHGSERRILFFAYCFPPLGGGGTPRSVKFVKYLHQYKYFPTILTLDPTENIYHREFQPDEGLKEELSGARFDVVRVADPVQGRTGRRVFGASFFPLLWATFYPWLYERERCWSYAAARAFMRRQESKAVRLIYVSAAPYSSLVAGAWLAKKLRVPFVADLRDLWTLDTLRSFPSRLHYLWESRLELRTLRASSCVIANTPLSADRLRGFLGRGAADKVVVIPNGFDAEEVCQSKWNTRRLPSGSSVTLVYAGTLHDSGLIRSRQGRYRPAGLDSTARSFLPVAQALVRLLEKSPATYARLRVRLLGFLPEETREMIGGLGLTDVVSCEGVLPRAEAVAAVRSADAHLVFQVAWEDPARPMPYVPGKVYESLATGAPILAPVGPGDLKDMLAMAPQAYVCSYKDIDSFTGTMQRMVDDLDYGRVQRCDENWLKQHERSFLTGRLAAVFDSVLEAEVQQVR